MVIIELSEADRLANHIPEFVWQLSQTEAVFIEDYDTGELVQVLDLREEEDLGMAGET